MQRAGFRFGLVISVGLLLVGCGKSGAPSGPASTASTAPAAASIAVATSSAAPGEHAATKRYRIAITYPRLPAADAALKQALHRRAANARRTFLHALPDPEKYPEVADRQMLLKIDFSVAARMPAFVSVREKGMAQTGGAHPVPLDAAFVYATAAGKLITLDDLFTKPDAAREHLAQRARKALQTKLLAKVPGGARTPQKVRDEWIANMRQMIRKGTQPTPKNYANFVVLAGAGDRASGLLLVFPPYQVAPGVYGTQTVQVPVSAFADLLKPAYRDAFDIGG